MLKHINGSQIFRFHTVVRSDARPLGPKIQELGTKNSMLGPCWNLYPQAWVFIVLFVRERSLPNIFYTWKGKRPETEPDRTEPEPGRIRTEPNHHTCFLSILFEKSCWWFFWRVTSCVAYLFVFSRLKHLGVSPFLPREQKNANRMYSWPEQSQQIPIYTRFDLTIVIGMKCWPMFAPVKFQ